MNSSKQTRFTKPLALAALACACAASPISTLANDWTAGTGWWDDAANWNGGVPDNSGGWAIGNIGNNGTAFITNTVPHVSEAWAGNGGVAGTIVVTNGGTLPVDNWLVVGRTGGPGNTPLSTLVVAGNGIINKTGDGFIVGDGTFCLGQVIVKDSAHVNITGGWNGIGNGSGGQGWLTLQDNAVYTLAAQDWNIGDYGSGRGYAYIKDNATLNVSRFFVGKNDTAFGVVWQTGGAVVGTGGNANEWTIGGDGSASTEAFGFYSLSAGTFSNPFNFQIGRYGKGLFYLSGGTVTQGSWCSIGRFTTGLGILYVSGGQFIHTSTSSSLMVGEGGSRGELTVVGPGSVTTAREFAIGNGGTGYVNLNGGSTLTVPRIAKWGGTGYLNLNGGTIRPTAADPSYLGGLNEAVVYSGGVVFDTAGFDVSVSQALVAPSGDGVQNIPIADGGAGYQAPPVVQIDASGVGSGATAVAQINPVTGLLTNIVVTGSGYGYAFAPTVNLIGGGATATASLNSTAIAPVSSGGLTKNGIGTLTLSGANTYTGATAVNAGKLVTSTDSTGAGAYSVATGAGLGVNVLAANAQLNQSSLTLGASTLDVDLGSFGNPTAAPLNVTGALAVDGAVTVNIATALPQLGQVPLIAYGSRTGAGSFVIGSLPSGVVATIVTNGNVIALNVSAVAAPRWDGQVNGVWDIGTTANWIELSTSAAANYADGNAVLFNDSASGTTSVTLGVTVSPAKVTVNNTNLSYSISGGGKISGATGLTKQGSGSLALNTANDYTGVTRLEGGTVSVTNLANGGLASAIGKSSSAANNLVLAGGALSYAGPATAVDRGYTAAAPNATIDAQSDLGLSGPVVAAAGSGTVKTGPAKLSYLGAGVKELSGGANPGYRVEAGTLVFNGNGGGQTNHTQNDLWVANTINQGADLVLSNTVLNVDGWVAIGRGNGSSDFLSTATLYNSRLRSGNFSMGYDNGIGGNLARQTLTLNGTSSITNGSDMNLGESVGSTSTIQLNDNSALFSDWRIHLGWHVGAVGTMTLANSSSTYVDAWFSIGHEGGTGTLTVKDNSTLRVLWDMNVTDVGLGTGTMNIQGNAQVIWGSLFVGKGVGSVGLVNQTGGSVLGTDFREAHVGFHGQGTYNLSAGSIVAPSHWFVVGRYADGPGEFNVTGGTFTHGTTDAGRLFRVGEEGTGVLNVSGTGSIVSAGDAVTLGNTAAGNGTINLNGGSLQARRLLGGPGVGNLNFNGGVLRVGANPNVDFITGLALANVLAGGAIIDTGTNSVGIGQALLDGGGNGGLTKQGTGALYLNGANTYLGTTLVSAGTLGGNGTIAGPVTIAAGATLSPGASIGVLTLGGTLNLNGTSTTLMELSKNANTNDSLVIPSITYAGTLVLKTLDATVLSPGDTFKLFTATTYGGSFSSVVSQTPGQTVTWDTTALTTDGTVKVVTAVATPATISTTVSGGNLNLTWPASQLGYRLEVQTNPLSVGVSTNWVTVPGSTAVTSVSVPISTTTPTVFYRLVFP